MGSSPPTTAPPTSSSTTPPSRLTVTAASRTTSGSSTPAPRGPRARRPRRSTRSEIAALHCGIRVIRRYPAPRQSAGPRHGGPQATASELGQLRAGHGDPYQAPGEIDDQGGVVFDTDDPAEPVLVVCYLVLLREQLGRGGGGGGAEGAPRGGGRGGGGRPIRASRWSSCFPGWPCRCPRTARSCVSTASSPVRSARSRTSSGC